VVVHIWDDPGGQVLPSTYFTNTLPENWTRHSSEPLGSGGVPLDLDWQASPSQMRAGGSDAILADATVGWSHRVLQVTDAVGAMRIRILVSAVDAPEFSSDLRCHDGRAYMVEWLHQSAGWRPQAAHTHPVCREPISHPTPVLVSTGPGSSPAHRRPSERGRASSPESYRWLEMVVIPDRS
jgi:hypothetical protein